MEKVFEKLYLREHESIVERWLAANRDFFEKNLGELGAEPTDSELANAMGALFGARTSVGDLDVRRAAAARAEFCESINKYQSFSLSPSAFAALGEKIKEAAKEAAAHENNQYTDKLGFTWRLAEKTLFLVPNRHTGGIKAFGGGSRGAVRFPLFD